MFQKSPLASKCEVLYVIIENISYDKPIRIKTNSFGLHVKKKINKKKLPICSNK